MTAAGASNPFATRFTRPGAIEFLLPPGESPESLIARLRANAWQGELVGPHGVGKSTLLAMFATHLAAAGRQVVHAALHQGETTLPPPLDQWKTWNSATQVIVDGYEQLTWWSRSKLAWRVREQGAGLLVTSHAPTGLPLLMSLAPKVEVALQVVRQLMPDEQRITNSDVERTFLTCNGNIREMLFQLYDLYQLKSQSE